MWGRAMGGAPQLLPLLLLLPGAVGLECLSCGAQDDGSCREATNVTCPPESDVCAEALAAVTWSHGRWALGARGCGRGAAGGTARALELPGLVLFARRRQSRGGGAGGRLLPLGPGAALPLPLPANESARVPNGVLCYGCPDDGPCPPTTVVQCYDDLRGCFHGNVTLTLGGATLWREVRGCVGAGGCARAAWGDGAVGLRGSCCAGHLCNGPPANGGLFAPDLPRLQLLPHGHAPTATPHATKMAAGTAESDGGLKEGEDAAKTATARAKMAATGAKMAATGAKMATTGAKMAATGTKMATTRAKMATTRAKMATTRAKMAAGSTSVATDVTVANVNLANANMAAVDPNMAAADPNMAAADPNMAAADRDVAAVDPTMAARDPAGDNMAAGRAAPGAGRPLERKDGIKGPVGRGHPMAGPGWLLPFLLLPLL